MKTVIITLITLVASSSYAVSGEFSREFAEANRRMNEARIACEADLANCSCYALKEKSQELSKQIAAAKESPVKECLSSARWVGTGGDGPSTTDWVARDKAMTYCKTTYAQLVSDEVDASAEYQASVLDLEAINAQKAITCN